MRPFSLAAFLLLAAGLLPAQTGPAFQFVVSGDSRNCGDIVMPAIAQSVHQTRAEFYWHLGDFRAIYTFDEDLIPPAQLGLSTKPMTISAYESAAWPDFIAHQMVPFANLPVFLSPGNHEMIPPATREQYLIQFADWLNTPTIREQRLKDDPKDHKLRSYYHWIHGSVDFLSLDNASAEQFDAAQLRWIRSAISRDEASANIQTIIVGMHEALPGSLSDSHSMSDSAQGVQSGRVVYEALLHAQNVAHKHVYVLASHSHFYMEDIFRTDTWKGKVLPGWIVGTAGAVRYRLPKGVSTSPSAMTDVYGFMLVSVQPDGAISTSFHKLSMEDLEHASPSVPQALVRWCYEQNKQME
jgi:hypothetical protein